MALHPKIVEKRLYFPFEYPQHYELMQVIFFFVLIIFFLFTDTLLKKKELTFFNGLKNLPSQTVHYDSCGGEMYTYSELRLDFVVETILDETNAKGKLLVNGVEAPPIL